VQSWPEIRTWRRAQRELLLARRMAMTVAARTAIAARIERELLDVAASLPLACVGYYWPFKGETDLHPLVAQLIERGATAALPVVVEKQAPMIFRAWAPGQPLARGIWDIPIPADGPPVQPSLLLVPLLGFDGAGFRLGYGGGYYDRTLAALHEKPLTIGVGGAGGRLDTIHPQAHDIPMDRIVTEDGWLEPDAPMPDPPRESRAPASSPCQIADAPADYMGYIDAPTLANTLNELLMAERAGARAVAAIAKREAAWGEQALLQSVVHDEASCCAMLTRQIARLGATPSAQTGEFYHRLIAVDDYAQQLALLNRGQVWVVRKLLDVLPRVQDPELARDLRAMLDVHERNIAACAAVLTDDDRRP